MTADELQLFVRDGLARGLSRSELESALLEAGWPPDHVDGALARYAKIDFPIPVPRPKPYLSARDTFLYLVLFTTLYIGAVNLGTLCFQLINRAFPDPTDSEHILRRAPQTIRWAIASLVVAVPVFLAMTWLTNRDQATDADTRMSKERRWLTYLTLFVTAGFIVGDLITLIYNVLGGELTARFFLKVLTVGAIAGAIFGYYLTDLRRDERA